MQGFADRPAEMPQNDCLSAEPTPPRAKQRWSLALLIGAACALLAFCAVLFGIRQYTVAGTSMEPSLMAGDVVRYVGFAPVRYGDIVIFDAGDVYGLVVKRVVGLPGDTIEITVDGHLLRNGTLQEESNRVFDPLDNSGMRQITVEEGALFVLGDNRASSVDSRDARIGQISRKSVRGVVTQVSRAADWKERIQ